jgi:SAM-dependent methyltransferase
VPATQIVKTLHDIPGWFGWIDQAVFTHFLSPGAVVWRGDVVELGAYLGKSAALLGRHIAPGETLTVCDLFGAPAAGDANRRENAKSYATLDRAAFERNYLALFDELPVIVQDFSSTILDHVAPSSVRFLHVDASHMYEHVVLDVQSAEKLLLPDGVVAFDDFRSDHTPGVSAAVWEAVFLKGLQPICVTHQKLYGTFGDRVPHQARLRTWLADVPKLWSETQTIAGAPVVRIAPRQVPRAAAAKGDPGAVETRLGTLERRIARLEAGQRDTLSAAVVRRVRRRIGDRAAAAEPR